MEPIAASPSTRSVGPAIFAGFAAAVTVWSVWYVTHLPWLHLAESVSIPVILLAWFASIILSLKGLRKAALLSGLLAGGLSAVLGLLVLGSKLVTKTAGDSAAVEAVPSAGLIAAGFVVAGLALGALAGFVASRWPARSENVDWLSRFATLTAVSVIPLLIAGGLVTSADAGMAVPDWPNSFGSNMFLYPLGPRVQPVIDKAYRDIYLEHAHRLFGALVGLTSLTLMFWTWRVEPRKWVRIMAIVAFALVCVQGVLGGYRVVENDRVLAAIHGISAQLIFGLVIAIATVMSGAFRSLTATDAPATHRRLRAMATAALHLTILQLVFGAIYRHFRHQHVLYSHIAFSVIVLLIAIIAGFLILGRLSGDRSRSAVRTVRMFGGLVVGVVSLQFILGWLAFFVGGKTLGAEDMTQALIRTAHQANGAALIACLTAAAVFTRRLSTLAGPKTADLSTKEA